MDKVVSLNLIGIVLAIVIGLSVASQIENVVEGHRSFYYTNLDPIDYSYGTGGGRPGIIGMLTFIIVTFLIVISYYLKLYINGFVTLGDSIKNIINYFMYLKMLFVGLGIFIFAFMSYQIYTRGESMDIITLVSMIIFVVLYFLGGVYLFFYDKINAFFKTLWEDFKKSDNTTDSIITGGGKMVKGGYLHLLIGSLIQMLMTFYGIILAFILAIFITICVLLTKDDQPSKIAGIVLSTLVSIALLIFQIYLIYHDSANKTTISITILVITIIVLFFIFSKIYFFINLPNCKTIGVFLNLMIIIIIAFFSVMYHIFGTTSISLGNTNFECTLRGYNLMIILILTIEIIMTGIMCFSGKNKDNTITTIGSIGIIIGVVLWIMIVYSENIMGVKSIVQKLIERIKPPNNNEPQPNQV